MVLLRLAIVPVLTCFVASTAGAAGTLGHLNGGFSARFAVSSVLGMANDAEDKAAFLHNAFHTSENGTLTLGIRYNELDRFNEQVFLPMPARLARKILYLTLDPSDSLSTLRLSQSELAEFVGATREAVSKTLSTWKKANVIESTRGGLHVLDRDALQVMADLHPI